MSLSLELASHLFSFLGHEATPALLALHEADGRLRLRFRPSIGDLLEVCRVACVDADIGIPDVLALFAHHRQYILIDYLLHCHQPFSYTSKALTIAAGRGDAYLLQVLLSDERLRVPLRALNEALRDGHARCAKMLFDSGRLPASRISFAQLRLAWLNRKTRRTFMKYLRGVIAPNYVLEMFEQGLLYPYTTRGVVPLMLSLTSDMHTLEKIVRICIRRDRVDVAVRIIDGAPGAFSPELLEHAAEEGALGVVRRLIKSGLNPKFGNGATMRAALMGNSTRVIMHLLRVDALTSDSMDLVLMHACFANDHRIIRAALKHVDCHPRSEIFLYACRMGLLKIVELLVNDPRVNPRVGNDIGPDAGIIVAFQNSQASLAKFLISHPRTALTPGSDSFARVRAVAESPELIQLLETKCG